MHRAAAVPSFLFRVWAPARAAACARAMTSPVRAAYDGAGVNGFLRSSRAALSVPGTTVYLGNEACDLDSVASALALAFADGAAGGRTVAVLNCARADLPLRRDVERALCVAGVDLGALVFAGDADLLAALGGGAWSASGGGGECGGGGALVLVDHNELAPQQWDLARFVRRIVDHHADAGRHVGARRAVRRAGSCASIVATEVADDAHIPPPLAYLLLAAILVDTHALERRTTPEDEAAAARLARIAQVPRERWGKIRHAIARQRAQVDGFSARELLLKDYKTFAGDRALVGISSVAEGLAQWAAASADRRLTAEVLGGMMQEKNVDAMIVMSSFSSGGQFRREILIFGDSEAAGLIREKLPDREGMDLSPMQVPGFSEGLCFAQNNLEASRKITAPHVTAVLANEL